MWKAKEGSKGPPATEGWPERPDSLKGNAFVRMINVAATTNKSQISGASCSGGFFFLTRNLIRSSALLGEDRGSWLLLWPYHLEDVFAWSPWIYLGMRRVRGAREL